MSTISYILSGDDSSMLHVHNHVMNIILADKSIFSFHILSVLSLFLFATYRKKFHTDHMHINAASPSNHVH